MVVQKLLNPPFNSTQSPVRFRALVRDINKAKATLPAAGGNLEIMQCNLLSKDSIKAACEDAAAAVWCATGFSDSSDSSLIGKLMGAFKLKFTPQESVDIAAMRSMGACFKDRPSPLGGPSIVMCSSAGVTRPSWSQEKKSRYEGCADIPIVRLNPLGILDVKRQGEEALRAGGASYVIVRPCGLNDKWPAGRPVLSQGDVAVGRINREDVAEILTRMVFESEAQGLTFETIALPGFPVPRDFGLQLSRLIRDSDLSPDGALPDMVLDAQYSLMQQLVPGESLQPNRLAMGQTYEQLDAGEQGRLGARGEELPPIVRSESVVR